MSLSAIAIGLSFNLVISAIWLLFLSDMFARFVFRTDQPFERATKCVFAGVALSWAINFAMAAWSPFGPLFLRFDWMAIVVDIAAPVLVFLWELHSFKRHWTDDEDLGEVFE